jgi:hypothetical protein
MKTTRRVTAKQRLNFYSTPTDTRSIVRVMAHDFAVILRGEHAHAEVDGMTAACRQRHNFAVLSSLPVARRGAVG